MNASDISPKTNLRMSRIQKFSECLRTFFFITAVLGGLGSLGRIIFELTSHRPHAGLNVLDSGINLTWAVGLWYAYQLFSSYARGSLFSGEIVSSIRRIGLVCILLGIEHFFYFAQGMEAPFLWLFYTFPNSFDLTSMIRFVLELLFRLIPGFAIICVAWVMNEGRKIQEEQELTV